MTIVNKKSSVFQEFSKTEAGPKTDGKSKRKSPAKPIEKSCNDAFCKFFFGTNEIKEAFHLYIEFLFSNCNSDNLCKTFKYLCCHEAIHTELCAENWLKLKEFFQKIMLEDLQIVPWNYESAGYTTFLSEDFIHDLIA